jgi:glycosyltransferase involved in cell wall biosynthesis
MTTASAAYSVVTPVRNELENLPRLAEALRRQTILPREWVVADTGSTDGTLDVADRIVQELPWAHVLEVAGVEAVERGGPVVLGFETGVSALRQPVGVIVKLDADVSLHPDHFERLLEKFAANPRLGIASGTCYEQEGGRWVRRRGTGASVWGAARAFDVRCLEEIGPLPRRMGWDGVDAVKASLAGWETATFDDLPFFHHRVEGERDGRRTAAWSAMGRASHYMGYRPSYLVLRALNHARRERAALAMIGGYAVAALRREPQYEDAEVRAHLRRQQTLSVAFRRARESLASGDAEAAPAPGR